MLEEIVTQGAERFPSCLAQCPGATETHQIAVLVGGLMLGADAAEAVRDVLRGPDSKEKHAMALGLGEFGHPEVEGYFARLLRERASADAVVAALRCLGHIRGERSFPLLVRALDDPGLLDGACAALARYANAAAARELEARAEALPAFQALAEMGPASAAERFVAGLAREGPWAAAAVRGIGNLGDPALGGRLLPLLADPRQEFFPEAFRAYARLGAPEGPEPLLQAARKAWQPWMVEALAPVEHPEVRGHLIGLLPEPGRRGALRRWLRGEIFRRRPDGLAVCRALRGARDPEVARELARRLGGTRDLSTLRALLAVAAFTRCPEVAPALEEVWRRGSLPAKFLAARVLLQAPTPAFLGEALAYLGLPGFTALDGARRGVDGDHLLRSHAHDNNPFSLFEGFLYSGLVDLKALRDGLCRLLSGWEAGPTGGPAEFGIDGFLQAYCEARADIPDAVARLWGALGSLDDQGDSLLDLFLCSEGAHRGGVQRLILHGFAGAVGHLIRGRDHHYLPVLEEIAAQAPAGGAAAEAVGRSLQHARGALKAECRDLVLLQEGSQKGDMVLIEAL